MTLWRYRAIEFSSPGEGHIRHRGELAGASAAEVRASLRRVGLHVIDVRQVRRGGSADKTSIVRCSRFLRAIRDRFHAHLRRRRQRVRGEVYDSLATMLESGLPLLDAIDTLTQSGRRGSTRSQSMLVQLREKLRDGASMADSMTGEGGWFDSVEIAIVESAQRSGQLAQALRRLAQRSERSGELEQKLLGALSYPFLVLLVGLGVVIFLSVRTLPDLVGLLESAMIDPPLLTKIVMAFGAFLTDHWILVLGAFLGGMGVAAAAPAIIAQLPESGRAVLRHFRPRLLRQIAIADFSVQFAELTGSGIPVVESLRTLAPTCRSADLQRQLIEASVRVERGEDLMSAMSDEYWFDAEFRRLLDLGQNTGELDQLLVRLGGRTRRQAERSIGRFAALLEPTVILMLAAMVGVVVLSAILPLTRLQEIL